MALACGPGARAVAFHTRVTGAAPVGAFLELEARVVPGSGDFVQASARATSEGRRVAEESGTYRA